MRTRILFTVLFSAGLVSGFGILSRKMPSYDFTSPNERIILPDTLREISGLTAIDAHTLACVQDENGILFLYDVKSKQIRQQIPFHGNGDYEGLAPVGKDLFVLRSDATLFQLKNYRSSNLTLDSIKTEIPAFDNEGLCYDRKHHRLLIGAKSKSNTGADAKNQRAIFSFDLATRKVSETPAFILKLNEIKAFAAKNNILLPPRESKKGEIPNLKIKISGIYLHPQTQDLYVLSAADYYLFVLNPKGELIHMELLNPKLFNKSEGIAILRNGELYISNEGQLDHANLLYFKPKKQFSSTKHRS